MHQHASQSRRAGGLVRGVTLALAVVAAAGLVPAFPATAAPRKAQKAPITSQFFGVHHAGLHADGPVGWPQAPVGSIRMWDNGVSWRELETAPGVFDWTRIDAEMAKAREHAASVLLVLGQTPAFHSTRPGAPSSYGPGASAMPAKDAWVRYVQEVARRNQTVWGGIADFQVWNEANVSGYWTGTPTQMAALTAWTRAALKAVAPTARLVAPAMVTRLTSQRAWLDAFYGQRVAGRNVSSYVDALSFQLYPLAPGSPEGSMALLTAVRQVLRRHHVAKPIWNTEVNYGMVGGPTRAIPQQQQVGNVIRTYVLNAGNGVSRVYWYSWDLLGMSNTPLVESDRATLTAAGQAFGTARSWLLGTRPVGCSRTAKGIWTCTFTTPSQTRRVVWNPTRTTTVNLPRGSNAVAAWNGTAQPRRAGSKVAVGPVPVLLTTQR